MAMNGLSNQNNAPVHNRDLKHSLSTLRLYPNNYLYRAGLHHTSNEIWTSPLLGLYCVTVCDK